MCDAGGRRAIIESHHDASAFVRNCLYVFARPAVTFHRGCELFRRGWLIDVRKYDFKSIKITRWLHASINNPPIRLALLRSVAEREAIMQRTMRLRADRFITHK